PQSGGICSQVSCRTGRGSQDACTTLIQEPDELSNRLLIKSKCDDTDQKITSSKYALAWLYIPDHVQNMKRHPGSALAELSTTAVKKLPLNSEKYFNIFEWLQLFDFNIIVILIIMIVVATINMIVALLVIILERTQMIGILKSLGTTNWSIRKVFLYNAGYIILRGLFWGNLIGIALVLLQQQFGIVKLNPQNYYVTEAPVYFNLGYILLLNAGTLLISLLVLMVPSYVVTRISPVRAIRFE
ncbi:MAG: FtsX-like permease family protein, partial [Pedobacter sp.]